MKNEDRKGGKLEIKFKSGPYTIAEDLGKDWFSYDTGTRWVWLNNGCHWLTISTFGLPNSTVKVYDSSGSRLPHSAILQITSLLHSTEDSITIQYANVQQWKNGCECGLFSLLMQ